MDQRRIIGLVAHPAAGKGAVSEYLKETYGFQSVSGGDILRAKLRDQRVEITKLTVSALATQLRSEHGPAVLLEESLGMTNGDIAIDGLRHPAEAEKLRQYGGKLLAIATPARISYARMRQGMRADRPDDAMTFEDFLKFREKEAKSTDPHGHNVNRVLEMADFTICNAHSIEITHAQVDKIMASI